MAFVRRFTRTGLVAAVAGTATFATTSSTIFADDGLRPRVDSRPGRSTSGEKLPIYPNPENDAPITLIDSPHPLSPYIARARESVAGALSGAGAHIGSGVSRWITFERRVEGEIKSILPPDESLTPGIIYVLISGLTASVFTRTRSLPLRFLSPPLFTLAAMPLFLPKTSHNIRTYLSDVEDEYFPDFAAGHDQFLANATTHTGQFLDRFGRVGEEAKGLGRRAVKGVENATGLKVGEAVRRGQERVEREKERLERDPHVGQVEMVGYVVEQRPVAEIVVPVAESPSRERVKRMV